MIGKSIPQKIKATALYQSGRQFQIQTMVREIYGPGTGTRTKQYRGVNHALYLMKCQGLVVFNDGLYAKPQPRHWIHKIRLSNTQRRCLAERVWI